MRTMHSVVAVVIGAALAAGCAGEPGASSSPASPSFFSTTPTGGAARPGSEAALRQWLVSSNDRGGAYFLPHMSTDANGNPVIAGTASIVVFQPLGDGGSAFCVMEPEDARTFFRIGPNGAMDHVNGPARMTYRRYGPGLVLVDELAGLGKLNVHLQGELQTIIIDGENGETGTILTVGDRSSAETVTGVGRVEPIGGGSTRDLRCGLRNDARGDLPRTYIELK